MPSKPLSGWPLFRLPELIADKTRVVVVCEGEKAIFAIPEPWLGVTWPGGCSRWMEADLSPLEGRRIILWPDNDASGMKAMDGIAGKLAGRSILSRVVPAEVWPEKVDAADFSQTDVISILKAFDLVDEDAEDGIRGRLVPISSGSKFFADVSSKNAAELAATRHTNRRGNNLTARVEAFSGIEPENIEWLWPGRVAIGKLTLAAYRISGRLLKGGLYGPFDTHVSC